MPFLGFRKRHFRDIPRIGRIIAVASRHGFGHFVEQMGLQRFFSFGRRIVTFKTPPSLEHRLSAPERLRLMFEELGPTFIKLGQVLACRPDMLPIEYSRELAKLTDDVAPFPSEKAKEIIEQELHGRIELIFGSFYDIPVAAASIAQVHRATLLDGTKVMVKVQRPDIDKIIDRDISILRGIADLIESRVPELSPYNVSGIVDEFAHTIKKELDFYMEASSAAQLRRNFDKSKVLYIPRVFSELSTKRVLVLERIEGIRINEFQRLDEAGFDRRELALKGADAFFKMVLKDGLFHADPHPGNIFVLSDGRIALVDFGIMGRVTEENMEHFANIFVALSEHDYDALVRQYVNLGFLSPESMDTEKFEQEVKEDLAELLEPYYGMQVKQIDFGAYIDRVTSILLRYKLKQPSNLYLMDKALITLEGLLKQLDPAFNYFEAAQPYVVELVRRRKNPLRAARAMRKNLADLADVFTQLPRQMKATYRKFIHGDLKVNIHHEGLTQLITDLDKASNRLSFSIITAAIIVASSIIIHSGKGPMLFGLPMFGLIGYIIAAFLGLWILVGILRSGQL
jgi:ubiquinone biosynthesis protein